MKEHRILTDRQEMAAEDEEEDPADTLARQLREYKRYKSAALWLNRREQGGFRTFLRVSSPPRLDGSLDLTGITIDTLADSLAAVIDRSDLKENGISLFLDKPFTQEELLKAVESAMSPLSDDLTS